MRAIAIISFLALYFINDVQADLTLLYDVRQDKTLQQQYKVLVKPALLRIVTREAARQDFILNLQSGEIIQLDRQQQGYFSINTQTINQYVALYRQNQDFFQRLIAQSMAQLDPQQRAKVASLMRHLQPQQAGDNPFKLLPTQRRKKMFGVHCQVVEMWQNTRHLRDICLARYQDLQFPASAVKTLEMFKKLIAQFRQQATARHDLLSLIAGGIETLQGLPLEIVELNAHGKAWQVTRLATISRRSVPDDVFRIPPGYQQKMMPL